ncbi:MAG TPA: hypothetical protein VHW66_22160 [Stellaceae bacterium]|jgi:hypothetical protein|nr:hypothetical protein [Stellaceae bacterium]
MVKKGDGKRRLPTGQEIMRRRAPSDLRLRPARFEFDPKKAYTTEQLAEIGAIALKWNQIEAHIDFVGTQILYNKSPFWLRLTTDKIFGTNTKLRLLKECLSQAELLDDKTKACVANCFSVIEQCRAYRNAIIHHHIYDHEQGIGQYVDDSRSSYQILVSLDALKLLYEILCSLLEELREIDLLFRIETDAQRPGRLDTDTGEFHYLGEDELRKKVIPEHRKRILALQQPRKALEKKLPKFPDADLIRGLDQRGDDGADAV